VKVVIAAMLVLACDGGPPPAVTSVAEVEAKPEPEPIAASAPEVDPTPKATILGEPLPAPAPPPIDAGPAAPSSGVTVQEREQAVLELLAGAAPAARFLLDDVDPYKDFDKGLRDVVAPAELGAVPRIKQGNATVSGGLDRDIVRRIVRSHINEVRHCYNLGLVRNTSLRGEITLGFQITADGRVTTSTVSSSTLRGASGKNVGACFEKAVRRWRFPKPIGGGTVDVVYPFELSAE
jgi:outer membrane biosynthesis protein TonB